ncbi:MAG: hypothetical protein ABJJ37_19575, partial [Roseibium sp.]
MTEKARPKPRSFDISDGKPEKVSKSTKTKRQTKTEPPAAKPKALNVEDVTLTNDVVETLDERIEINKKPKRGIGWLSIFFAALGMLASLAIGLAVDQLIRDLFSRHEWLG